MEEKQYILAVPNFSEGADSSEIKRIVDAVQSVATAKVISVESEANFNRTVLTFIIEVQYSKEAMLKMAETIFKYINMENQMGDHPRIGALDILPIFPLRNITIEETIKLASDIGEYLFKYTEVPIYFSGLNALTANKSSIPFIRGGQYEGLKELLKTGTSTDIEERKPDLSLDGMLDPEKGACIVMADMECPIAYNVYIASEEIEVTKEIARIVKNKEKGFPSIKSIGFKDKSKQGTAVSMNVFDAEETPLLMLQQFIDSAAKKRATKVIATEIVGPVKRKHLMEAARSFGFGNMDMNDTQLIHLLEEKMYLVGFNKSQIIEAYLTE